MLKNISFRQIEIFLTAAKYENFSKAAEELFMTQASVSRNIAAMEETLGIVLFVRHRQKVCLTEAGRSLSKDLRLLVKKADSAYARALEKQENLSQRLKVGDVNYTDADQYLMPIAKKLEARYPEAQLILERSEADVLVEFLETDRYDAIFLINDLLPTVTASDICRERVCTVDPCIVLADTHPLFSKEEITLEDLRKEQMVASRSGCFRFYWDFVCAVSKEFGLNRSDVKFEDNFFAVRMELQRGKRIGVADTLFGSMLKEQIRVIPLANSKIKSGISLLYSEKNKNPLLPALRMICRDFYQQSHTFSV